MLFLKKLLTTNLKHKLLLLLSAFLVALAGQVVAFGGANLTVKLVLAGVLAAAEVAFRQVFPTIQIPGLTESAAPASPTALPTSPPSAPATAGDTSKA
jgi:hypothetical protein